MRLFDTESLQTHTLNLRNDQSILTGIETKTLWFASSSLMTYTKSVALMWGVSLRRGSHEFVRGDSRMADYYGTTINVEWATATSLPKYNF